MDPAASLERYKAAMLLSGAGDALGYRNQLWESNLSGPAIHEELKELGGLEKIQAELPDWPVSDDTVLHLATAEGLATGKGGEELLHEVAARYVEGMKDMDGRWPGNSCIRGVSQLKPGMEGGYRVPYNPRGTGCGAAMRSMCIGLRYPKPEQLLTLVEVAVETGRMTHPHPTGFLGGVASALFTAYAAQRRPMTTWGLGLIDEALPRAKAFVQGRGFAVEETLRDWDYFGDKWQRYLDLRGISNGVGPVIWPSSYGPAERDEVYNGFSLFGWGGDSGHDAPMIALDALLGAGSDWKELMNRGAFHGGQTFKLNLFQATVTAQPRSRAASGVSCTAPRGSQRETTLIWSTGPDWSAARRSSMLCHTEERRCCQESGSLPLNILYLLKKKQVYDSHNEASCNLMEAHEIFNDQWLKFRNGNSL
ncbi:ADP-ribosylarginine hydrolase isoform X2 [Brachionichthys hirsutus]|uniref:ADP-ribosylarginine hydrolase isoform X2 n=1 Tax=Brachionichthys hirsutus TaxID=412623 RepID=UPI0036053B16